MSSTIDGETLVVTADVTDEAAVRKVIHAAIGEYGTVTELVNNAAIWLLSLYDVRSILHEIDPMDFRRIMDVNVTGVFLFSKYAVPETIDAGHGNITNISSRVGRRGAAKWGAYAASKWAVEGLTRIQAKELDEDGINMNALDPSGRVSTGFWDHLPEAEHEDILDPDVMDDAATLLLAQGPEGHSGGR